MTVIDESGETAATIVPPSFDHVGLSVGDLDAQRRFYTTAFGFAETHQADFAEAGARVSLLQTPNGAALELTERAASIPGSDAQAIT